MDISSWIQMTPNNPLQHKVPGDYPLVEEGMPVNIYFPNLFHPRPEAEEAGNLEMLMGSDKIKF